MRIIAIVSVVVAAILAVALWFLISDYNKKAKIRRDELHLLDIEMYEEIKNNDNYFDADVTPADRELAEKMKNYNFYQKLEERMQVNVLFLGNEITDGIGVSDYTYNFLMVITENGRLDYFGKIYRYFVSRCNEKLGTEKESDYAEVDYAEEFAYKSTQELLSEGLIKETKEKKVDLDFKKDDE